MYMYQFWANSYNTWCLAKRRMNARSGDPGEADAVFVVITKSSSVHQKEAQAKYFDSHGMAHEDKETKTSRTGNVWDMIYIHKDY